MGDELDSVCGTDWDWNFMGGARVTFHANSGTAGSLFTFDKDGSGNRPTRIRILNPYLNCLNTPSVNAFAIDIRDGIEVTVSDARLVNCASWLRMGYSSTQQANRCTFRGARGNINKGATADATIDLVFVAGAYIFDNICNGVGAGSAGARNGAFVRMAPPADCLVDTVFMRWNSFQAFTTSTPSTAPADCDGRPYGIDMDNTNGAVTNVWACDNVIDHCTTAAIRFTGGGATEYSRNMVFSRNRMANDAGRAIDFNNSAASLAHGFDVSHNMMFAGETEVVRLQGNGWRGLEVSHNRIVDSYDSIAKDRAILVASNEATLIGNYIGSVTSAGTVNFTRGIQITNADISGLVVSLNQLHRAGTGLVEPTYTAASGTRYVGGNTG
jgi:hypothetical protein